MMCFVFDLLDACDIEFSTFPHCARGFLWDYSQLRLRIGRVSFNFEPNPESIFRLPNSGHFGPAVTWDHAVSRMIIDPPVPR